MHHPTDRITHTKSFGTSVVEHWLEREIGQWVHHEESIRRPIALGANALTLEPHLAPKLDTPVLNDWCNKGRGMCYPVRRMVHINEPCC